MIFMALTLCKRQTFTGLVSSFFGHRYYLATYETALRKKCGYTGAQPYWDWEVDNNSGLDMADWDIFSDTTGFGGNGPFVNYTADQNPFSIPDLSGGGCVPKGPFTWPGFSVNLGPFNSTSYNPRCLVRDFSRPLMSWGNQANINWVWDTSDYGWFVHRLENVPVFTIANIHGAGHFGVGGARGQWGTNITVLLIQSSTSIIPTWIEFSGNGNGKSQTLQDLPTL